MLNYYEVLGLPCEGKDRDNIGKIQLALELFERTIDFTINNESSEANRIPLREQKDAIPDMKLLVSDAALRKKHADELRQKKIDQLAPIIKILSECSNGLTKSTIAVARLNRIAVSVGLIPETVKKEFKNAGYEIVTLLPPKTDDFLIRESEAVKLENELGLIKNYFKSAMQRNPDDPMNAMLNVNDIYEYITVMDGHDLADVHEYHAKTTSELRAIFEIKMASHSSNNAPIMYYNHIESQAKTKIFSSDSEREKYDNYLKIIKLIPFFDTLKLVPDSIKLERTFAEECIGKIQNEFPDETQAIAIYNKYGGISPDTPYEKESTQIVTICTCKTINYHDSLEEAQGAKCTNCGAPLYKKCPSCGKYTPTISDYCSCGFFIKGIQSFEKHYLEFNDCIKKQDLRGATESFHNARACNPKDPRVSAMNDQLQKLDVVLGKPIEEINVLIASGMIMSAQSAIAKLRAERPNVNLEQFDKKVSDELKWANNEYAKVNSSTNPGSCVEICMNIATRVKDYKPALEWLRMHRPDPALNVRGTKNANALTYTLQWDNNPNNRFVTYSVVRKENGRPANILDGTMLVKNTEHTNYKDTALKPGVIYGYAVFAIRGEAESAPTYCNEYVCLFKDIESVQVNVNSNVCSLSWVDVPGSSGTRVLRSDDGGKNWFIKNQCCRGIFSDNTTQYGVRYKYLLQSVWNVGQKVYYSEGLMRDVAIEERPDPIDIELRAVDGNGTCEVVWNPNGKGVLKLLKLNQGEEITKNRVYSTAQLKQYGSFITETVPVNAGRYTWRERIGERFNVISFVAYGDDSVAGNTIAVSTVPSLKPDAANTNIENNILHLAFTDVPNGVTKICYSVTSENAFATEKMAFDGSMKTVDIATYTRDRAIVCENIPETQVYISVYAMYGAGKSAYLSPITKHVMSNSPKANISYRIDWQKTGWAIKHPTRKGAQLCVKSSEARIPEMSLCCRQDGKMIFNYVPGNVGIVELLRVPAQDVKANTEYSFAIDEAKMNGIPRGTDIQLFLSPSESGRYNHPIASDINSRKMPE